MLPAVSFYSSLSPAQPSHLLSFYFHQHILRAVSVSVSQCKKMIKKKIEAVEGNLGEKKALLIGLKHPEMNDVDVKGKILRMKKFLMDLRGFSENNITLLIEDGDPNESQPTEFNIRAETCYMVESANPGDILFIHLIAHGCSGFSITTSDKQIISDSHFRNVLDTACKRVCTLTIVSDCLIENSVSVCCARGIPTLTEQDTERFHIRHPDLQTEDAIVAYKGYSRSGLSPVTPIQKILHTLWGLLNPNLPNSCVILLNAFQCDWNAKKGAPWWNLPELFFPPPKTTTTTNQLYGGFTTAILDVLEETQGQVTNAELAHNAMEKLKMQGICQKPGLLSNHHHHADASFLF